MKGKKVLEKILEITDVDNPISHMAYNVLISGGISTLAGYASGKCEGGCEAEMTALSSVFPVCFAVMQLFLNLDIVSANKYLRCAAGVAVSGASSFFVVSPTAYQFGKVLAKYM